MVGADVLVVAVTNNLRQGWVAKNWTGWYKEGRTAMATSGSRENGCSAARMSGFSLHAKHVRGSRWSACHRPYYHRIDEGSQRRCMTWPHAGCHWLEGGAGGACFGPGVLAAMVADPAGGTLCLHAMHRTAETVDWTADGGRRPCEVALSHWAPGLHGVVPRRTPRQGSGLVGARPPCVQQTR